MAPGCLTETPGTAGRILTLLFEGYHVRYLERPVTVETDEIKTAKITNCILVYLIFNKKDLFGSQLQILYSYRYGSQVSLRRQ